MTHYFHNIATVFILVLFFICLSFSAGQDIPATQKTETASESEQIEPLKIMLSVNEVRLDVVVLDKKTGNPIRDLNADDFEVFQNGARQNILSSVYIDNLSDIAVQPSVPRKAARGLPPIPMPTIDLKREDTHRTIILVVDDLSMSFEDGYYAKMALRNFVEKQMQSGDMVAILKTGYGNSALQMFLSDKRQALARIDAMHLEMAPWPAPSSRIYDNQLSTLSYSLHALKDMPGRKILVMMTAQTDLGTYDYNTAAHYNKLFTRLADDAMRASVVVNFQFLEIPDLKKKWLALSNIFMITDAEDVKWMYSKETSEGVFFPMFQGEEVRSPALRTYKTGDNLQTLAMLYNADEKAIGRSEIKTQAILYKDSEEFMRGNPIPITLEQVDNSGNVPILHKFTVGINMPPGDYVLQLVATDGKNSKNNEGIAFQTLSFTVIEDQTCETGGNICAE